MASGGENSSLAEAAGHYLAALTPEEKTAGQQEVHHFVRWFGRERHFDGLKAQEIANYAERLSVSDTDYVKKLEQVRAFLSFARKKGWSKTSLATHLKTRKGKTGLQAPGGGVAEPVPLTRQGYADLEAELAALKVKRPQVLEEMRRAAADKDFRENAPLAAAREQRGHIEGRIRELEEMLKVAVIIGGGEKKKSALKAGIGDSLVLHDLDSGEELHYMIVAPREVDPLKGKISSASPLGKVLIGRGEGDEVEMKAPVGRMRYRIEKVGRQA